MHKKSRDFITQIIIITPVVSDWKRKHRQIPLRECVTRDELEKLLPMSRVNKVLRVDRKKSI